MRNIRLTLAYVGSRYVGWQEQPNGLSVQAVLERAIHSLTGEVSKVIASGRTDSGVHALGQVANFESRSTIPTDRFAAALQHHLPDDIVVRRAEEASLSFHATYAAKRKHYRYVIHNHRVSNPFVRSLAYHYRAPLDSFAMHQAAQELLGTHDFRSFESHFPNKASSVRTVLQAKVDRYCQCPIHLMECGGETEVRSARSDAQAASHNMLAHCGLADSPQPVDVSSRHSVSKEFVWFDIVGDGFLYNMVRSIVGTLIKVGRHAWAPTDVRRIISSQDRSQAGETAPAHGLYLVHVYYDEQ